MKQIAIREIGMIKDLYARISPYIGLINMTLLIATAYYTTVRHFLHISFLEFAAIVVLVVITLATIEYTIIMPSHYAFINEQVYKHRNLIRRDLEEIRNKEIKEILEEIKALKMEIQNLKKLN